MPNRQAADLQISSFRLTLPTPELERALRFKETLEKSLKLKTLLLLFVLMGTSMVIGDGILTPAISGTELSILHLVNSAHITKHITTSVIPKLSRSYHIH